MAEVVAIGDRVEIRKRFDAQWAHGFEVIAVDGDRVQVKRLSDGDVLPVTFAPEDVRPERKRGSMWWI